VGNKQLGPSGPSWDRGVQAAYMLVPWFGKRHRSRIHRERRYQAPTFVACKIHGQYYAHM